MPDAVNLFSNDGLTPIIPQTEKKVTIPGVTGEVSEHGVAGNKSLISAGIEDAIKGETVKSVIIPEEFEMNLPNYLLDFRNSGPLRESCVLALESLIYDEGDTHLYIWTDGLYRVGLGVGDTLDRILPAGMQSLFRGGCKIYKDVESNKPVKEIKQHDPTKIRLRL